MVIVCNSRPSGPSEPERSGRLNPESPSLQLAVAAIGVKTQLRDSGVPEEEIRRRTEDIEEAARKGLRQELGEL